MSQVQRGLMRAALLYTSPSAMWGPNHASVHLGSMLWSQQRTWMSGAADRLPAQKSLLQAVRSWVQHGTKAQLQDPRSSTSASKALSSLTSTNTAQAATSCRPWPSPWQPSGSFCSHSMPLVPASRIAACRHVSRGTTQQHPSAGWRAALQARCKSTLAMPAYKDTTGAAGTAAGAAAAAGTGTGAARLVGGEALAAGVPDHLRKQLMWWMAGTAGWVYTMVVLGGITRLTRSGLSMTDWKFTGERPPLTRADWETEFDKYRSSPEFKLLHAGMSLSEFKFIFWMEYAHRMWGRLLGLTFAVPAAYFAIRGAINQPLAKRLGLLFFMGGTQGLVGWWMVRSGLQEPTEEWQQPRVSPYRLAAHLVSAFAIFATLTWTALDLGTPAPLTKQLAAAGQARTAVARRLWLPFAALVATTATSGAFVAGMDAGRAYNEWPLMSGQWVPPEYWKLWDAGYGWRNFFENTAAVQFDHRTLAATTAAAAFALWSWVRLQAPGALPRRAVLLADLVAGVTAAQFLLGIWTLLEYVPVHLGSAHQANALNLFTVVLATLHALRPAQAGPAALAAARWATPMAVAAVGSIGVAVTQQH